MLMETVSLTEPYLAPGWHRFSTVEPATIPWAYTPKSQKITSISWLASRSKIDGARDDLPAPLLREEEECEVGIVLPWEHGKLHPRNRRHPRTDRYEGQPMPQSEPFRFTPKLRTLFADMRPLLFLEINRDGQLYGILRKELPNDLVTKVHSVAYSDGMPPRATNLSRNSIHPQGGEPMSDSNQHEPVKLNVINEPKDSYTGGQSSLCPGCGHDQISSVIIAAAWENGIEPHRIAKMSGIGCSSKTPAYYLGQSHGFNTVHGRMPSVTTGAYAVNKDLLYLGVSGDGDSASIGIGQLIHAIRRNMDMVYIVENNGVYGLTKGQYSATADVGSKRRKERSTQPNRSICAHLPSILDAPLWLVPSRVRRSN